MSHDPLDSKVAIVGVALRVPGADTLARYWQNLVQGKISITSLPADPARPDFVPSFGSIPRSDCFDFEFFRYSRREAELMDPQQRLLLECGWELQQALACGPDTNRVTAVFVGTSINTYLTNCIATPLAPGNHQGLELMLANDKDSASTRLSYKLGFTGPSVTVQTACSSSLVAVHLACQSILSGESDVAFAGGASIQWVPFHGHFYKPGHVYSRDGKCRPFDAEAAGTVFGDGVVLLALKRLDLAIDDGNDILGVIRGTATNNSGAATVGFTAPSYQAQKRVVQQAHANAGIALREVGFVETHGTGTPLGDPIEFSALRDAFVEGGAGEAACALGAVKANIGHLAAAAGAAGLVKAALCVKLGVIPPHPLFRAPLADVKLAGSPFFIDRSLATWKLAGPRYAGVSSFGMGGTNVHVVVEEPPRRPQTSEKSEFVRVSLSAPSRDGLVEHAREIATHLETFEDVSPSDVAHTMNRRPALFAVRASIEAASRHALVEKLRTADFVEPFADARADAPSGRLVGLPVPRLNGARVVHGGETAAVEPSSTTPLRELFETQFALMKSQLAKIPSSGNTRKGGG